MATMAAQPEGEQINSSQKGKLLALLEQVEWGILNDKIDKGETRVDWKALLQGVREAQKSLGS